MYEIIVPLPLFINTAYFACILFIATAITNSIFGLIEMIMRRKAKKELKETLNKFTDMLNSVKESEELPKKKKITKKA